MKRSATVNRRSFFRTGLAGLAGMAALPQRLPGQAAPAVSAPVKLPLRTLGRTGLRVTPVSMGVMNADNPALVRAALDAGIVHLDTAHGYQRGRNEEMVGQEIKGRRRDSFVVATKVPAAPMDRSTGLFGPETVAADLQAKLEISLRRLGLEYVDIFYLHNVWRREAVLFEPVLKVMQEIKKSGKARFLGVSTHRNEPETIRATAEAGIYDVVLTAYNFRQEHRAEVGQAIAAAARAGLGVVAMKTQAGVYWDREKSEPINMRAALKWALQNPDVHTAIPGFTTFDQMQEDLAVMADLALSEQEKRDLEHTPALQAGLYCQGCQACLPQCPHGLPIPDLMRSYMYAYGYRNLAAARDLLVELPLADSPCGDCGACRVRCRLGFDVGEKVRDIARLRSLPGEFLA